MWTWTICPVLIAHVLLCSLIGGLHYRGTCNKSHVLSPSRQSSLLFFFFDNGWMWVAHLLPKNSWSAVKQKREIRRLIPIWNFNMTKRDNCLCHLAVCCIHGRCTVVFKVHNQLKRSKIVLNLGLAFKSFVCWPPTNASLTFYFQL